MDLDDIFPKLYGWKTGENDLKLLNSLCLMSKKKAAEELNIDNISDVIHRLRLRYNRSKNYVRAIESMTRNRPYLQRMLLPTKPANGFLIQDDDELAHE